MLLSTSSLSVWNSGLGQITNGVSIGATGGSGSVAETVLFMEMDDFTSNNVSEEINFILGFYILGFWNKPMG